MSRAGSDRDEMNHLVDELRHMSDEDLAREWQRLEHEYQDFSYEDCLNPARADWTMLGDFDGRTVLDVGCGLSSVSISLAATAKHVLSVDKSLERVRFLAQIVRIKGIKNLTPVHGDITNLPLRPGAIDRIIMVGGLERGGQFYDAGAPREMQVRFLRYLHERLASDGELWVAIENRLAPRHFLGRTYHGDLPFTPLMPHWAANGITKLARREPYELHLSSRRGLRKTFADSGYRDVEFFYAVTDYRSPRFIASTARDAVIRNYMDTVRHGASLKSKLGMGLISAVDRLGLAGTFCPSFFIKATK